MGSPYFHITSGIVLSIKDTDAEVSPWQGKQMSQKQIAVLRG